jgi:hypothetical protein
MSFSYPLTMPSSPAPRTVKWSMAHAQGVAGSPFSYEKQVVGWGGEVWRAKVIYPTMTRDVAEQWIAFLLKNEGQLGSFYFGPPASEAGRGGWVGDGPLVKGGSQTGNLLEIDDLTINQTARVKVGDWCQLGSGTAARLHKVMDDANSNASGEATISLKPRILTAPADNAAITVVNPKGIFTLLTSEPSWSRDRQQFNLSLDIESVP